MLIIDTKRKCEWEGCTNLGDYNKKIIKSDRTIIYRRNLCCTHRKKKYGIINHNDPTATKKSDLYSKCGRCNWEGPCDVHRIKPGNQGGKYSKENNTPLCPNCHRLFHRGLIEYMGFKADIAQ